MKRIVHLGFGNFHRAHQAWYTQRAGGWRITGVAMTRPDLRDALAPENFAYSLLERGPDGIATTRMTVHDRLLVLPEDPGAVIAEIAAPETEIVTLTVTEKGYTLDQTGALDLAHPAVSAELHGGPVTTAIGILATALARRKAPLTVISCDNLRDNGATLRNAIQAYATAQGSDLAEKLDMVACFPITMVDRITPATTPALIDATGEPSPVLTEVFSEWVIEDIFMTPRPAWEAVGAVITDNVAPFEARKLHMLNAAHSMLAYRGLLQGLEYVHQAAADPALSGAMDRLWDEAQPLLPKDMHETLPAYREALIDRFSVAEMEHRLDQIAMDGSQKIPQRLGPILARAESNTDEACLAVAAWLAYITRDDAAPDPGRGMVLAALSKGSVAEALQRTGLAGISVQKIENISTLFQSITGRP